MSIEKIKKLRDITKAGLSDVKKALENTDYDIDKAIVWLRENGVLSAAKKSDRIAAEGVIKIKRTKNKIVIMEVNSETDYVAANEMFQKATDKILDTILKSDVNEVNELENLKIDNQSFKDFIAILISTIGEKIEVRRIKVFNLIKGINVSSYVHTNNRIGAIVIGKNIDENVLKDISMHISAMSPEFLSVDNIPQDKKDSEFQIAKKELAERLIDKPENIQQKIIEGKVSKALSEIVLLEQTFIKDSSLKIKNLQKKDGEILDFIRYEVGSGIEKKEDNFVQEVMKQAQG